MKSVTVASGSQPSLRAGWLSANPVAIAPGTDFTMLVDADVESRSQRWYGPTICVRTVSLSSLARTILAPDGRDSAILK